MRVGVYVDGFNVYYGARGIAGRATQGWRWLDLRSLVVDLIGRRRNWVDAEIERIIYCTAFIDGRTNPDGRRDQDIYIRALTGSGSVDHVELGKYVSRVKMAPLATRDSKGRPVLTTSAWPVMITDANQKPVHDAQFMVSYAHREEKGSDVNVAAWLLTDVLLDRVDAAVVISNDSDLRLPIDQARERVPVGLVNPTTAHLAGDLRGGQDDGVGRHWWHQLTREDLVTNQLPSPAGGVARPAGW